VLASVALLGVAAAGWGVAALVQLHGTGRQWAVAGLLFVLAIAAAELGRRGDHPHAHAGTEFRRDQPTVWSVAAAGALTSGQAVLLHVGVFGYLWLRLQRPAGELGYRAGGRACLALVGCLAANTLVSAVTPAWSGASVRVAALLSVLLAVAGYAGVTFGLRAVGMSALGSRARELLRPSAEPLGAWARLCLGGLLAYLAVDNPWLCPLVLAPMIALQRRQAGRELESAAMLDAKTGLLNALAWEELARRELIRGRRETHPVAVLLLDIDRFKLVNDRYGHLAGDAVLREVATALSEGVREADAVGRFGGEEFVVVLPKTGSREALHIAERLRARINHVQVAGQDGAALSASIGVACTPLDGDDLASLLQAADTALYSAKEHGRNRVRLAARGPDAQPLSG
jgi:diguanylate cyclase (GGDEF)-like protein